MQKHIEETKKAIYYNIRFLEDMYNRYPNRSKSEIEKDIMEFADKKAETFKKGILDKAKERGLI